ncbi:MAG TPA: hypothetical protein VMD59_22740 [Acidimicrobiales bacterium]|nr:hypothetical protein [Acidimicrobiales bacterium]
MDVHFPSMTVLPGNWWITPMTTATVVAVPESGRITVKLTSGDYSGHEVQIDPRYVELSGSKPVATDPSASGGRESRPISGGEGTTPKEPSSSVVPDTSSTLSTVTSSTGPSSSSPEAAKSKFEANRREATWGSVVEVAPGVGVELIKDQTDESYARFVVAQLEVIQKTEAGRTMIGEFDPSRRDGHRRPPSSSGPYQGLTVLIAPPPHMDKPRVGTLKTPVIKTEDVGPRLDAKTRDNKAAKIPRIQFFDLAKGTQKVGDKGEVHFTESGVRGHEDFPDTVVPHDVVLYHELCHARLSHLGIAGRLRDVRLAEKIQPRDPDSLEEELVVGILNGKGLRSTENEYRCQRKGVELRQSYKAVGIKGDDRLGTTWSDLPARTIEEAVRGLGKFSAKDVRFIVTGEGEPGTD